MLSKFKIGDKVLIDKSNPGEIIEVPGALVQRFNDIFTYRVKYKYPKEIKGSSAKVVSSVYSEARLSLDKAEIRNEKLKNIL